MKIHLCMKDPDALSDAIEDAVRNSVESLAMLEQLSEKEKEALMEVRMDQEREKCRHWLEYGEYINILIDTDADTAIVLRKE